MQAAVDFQQDVIEASFQQPVLVDFWADWCAPCRVLGPILEELAARAQGRWKLVKVDTELQPELATEFRVQSIPAVKLFSEGLPIAEFAGAMPQSAVERWLEQQLPSASDTALQAARVALSAGDHARARDLLTGAVEQDPGNQEARVLLARERFLESPDRALELVAEINEGDPDYELVDGMRTLARLSALAEAEPPAGADAGGWRRYQDGIRAFLERDYGAALDAWLEVMQRHRALDEDGARRASVALFHVLGDEHALTQRYRRRLAAALY